MNRLKLIYSSNLAISETLPTGYTITYWKNATDLVEINFLLIANDVIFNYEKNLCRVHGVFQKCYWAKNYEWYWSRR